MNVFYSANLALLLWVLATPQSFAQPVNDECAGAIVLNPGAVCNPLAGTTIGATHTTPEAYCAGDDDDDDVWYYFEATQSDYTLQLNCLGSLDGVMEVSNGGCAVLDIVDCVDGAGAGGAEELTLTNLQVGETYLVRVFSYSGPGSEGDFEICLTAGVAAPPNDDCANAIDLSVNSFCLATTGTTTAATHSSPEAACAGADDDDDVWYSFTATNSTLVASLICFGPFDGIMEISSGTCGSLNTLYCGNNSGPSVEEAIFMTGLTVGATYFIRVYSATNNPGAVGDFLICVKTSNDICSNAADLTPMADCSGSTPGSTYSTNAANALPASPCGGNADDDVWYKFVATQTHHTVELECLGIFDGVLQVRSGACGAQSSIACSNTGGTGATEQIMLNNVTVGATYYIRVWSFGSGSGAQGDFNICVIADASAPANDVCSNAAPLTAAATCNYTSGTTFNTVNGGGAFCSGNADDDVWYSFTASQSNYTVQLNCLASFNGVMEIAESDGSCNTFFNLTCYNNAGAGGLETAVLTGLQIGLTYVIRVYSFGGPGTEGNFQICLIANPETPANDDCGGAVLLTPQPTCIYTSGTTELTVNDANPPFDCPFGNADDDVWYQFTATHTEMTVHLNCIGSFNGVMEAFYGNCTGYTSAGCSGNTGGAGQPEEIQMTGLVVGGNYLIRIWSFGGDGSEGDFDICVQQPPAPVNDACSDATVLTPSANSACSSTAGTTEFASGSAPAGSCGGTADDDVWYRFTATSTRHLITLTCTAGFDGVVEVRSGNCNTQSALSCANNLGDGGTEELLLNAFTIGVTYYVRVWSFGGAGSEGAFNICVTTPVANDVCASATLINANNSANCGISYSGTTTGASASSPAPYCEPAANAPDVWYKFVATSTTHIINVTGNGVYPKAEVYATCGGAAIACFGIGFNEFVSGAAQNLTVGNTYLIRVYMSGTAGTFSLCVSVPQPNDLCANAVPLSVGNGACSNAINGQTTNTVPSSGPLAACGDPDDDVWYQFVATGTYMDVAVSPTAPFNAAFQVFSGNCAALTELTCVNNSSGNETTQLSGLTVGNTYFIRVFGAPGSAQGQGAFSVCVSTPPAPANDECSGAYTLNLTTMGSLCSYTAISTLHATQSAQPVSCTATGYEDDVWCKFTTNEFYTFTFSFTNLTSSPAGATQIGMEVYSGNCGALVPVENGCIGSFGIGPTGSTDVYLQPNTTYFVRLWVPGSGRGNFSLCVQRTTANCSFSGTVLLFCSQADVDNFPIAHPNCKHIPNNVNIGNAGCSTSNPIYNLDKLRQIETIGGQLLVSYTSLTNLEGLNNLQSTGNLFIRNNGLTSLEGLTSLTTVDGVNIIGNSNLTDISALGNITDFGSDINIRTNQVLNDLTGINVSALPGNLSIVDNPGLTSLHGLETVHTISGDLDISGNPALTTLHNLQFLTGIQGNLAIVVNDGLTDLDGLQGVTSIGGNLFVSLNSSLISLYGLNNLNAIGQSLYIGGPTGDEGTVPGNSALTDISALMNLTSINGTIMIYDNALLTSLTGLDNVDPNGITFVKLIDSPLLSYCEVESICNYLAVPSNLAVINFNAPNCNSRSAVQTACLVLPLELLSFTAVAHGKTNEVAWAVASAHNVDYHLLERSPDGLGHWESLHQVSAQNDVNQPVAYKYEDLRPLPTSYYRLRSVDFDGSSYLSNIVEVRRDKSGFSVLQAYPIPVADLFTISYFADVESDLLIQLMDVTGRVLLESTEKVMAGNGQTTLWLGDLPAGQYYVKVATENSFGTVLSVTKS